MKRNGAVKPVKKKEEIEVFITGGLVKLEPSCLEEKMMWVKIQNRPY